MSNYLELLSLAEQSSTASASDSMGRLGLTHKHYMEGLTAFTPDRLTFGEAVTVRSLPARPDLSASNMERAGGDRGKLPMGRAIESCTAGKVLVIDASGYHQTAVAGDVTLSRLAQRGAAGIVTDGSVRDRDAVVEFGFGVHCTGFTPKGGTGHTLVPYDFAVPVTCATALVRPGDYIFGDMGGVVVIPADQVAEVLRIAVAKEDLDANLRRRIREEDVPYSKYYPPSPEMVAEFMRKHTGGENQPQKRDGSKE